jgi:UDP-N-acetylmuramoyl-L-alanyl-D-glutamate--2,6-diaminopimelate ligase
MELDLRMNTVARTISWEELVKELDGATIRGTVDCAVTGLAYDSRRVRPGYVFVALAGQVVDGHEFVEDAINRGAVAVVAERDVRFRREIALIRVADSRRALAHLAARFYQEPSRRLTTIGVTGTNGKTSTTFMVRSLLGSIGPAPGLIGTVQYIIGERLLPASRTTPESLDLQEMFAQLLQAGVPSVVFEVSSHALSQHRVDDVCFDVGVFTNLTRDHLDYHHTMDAYFDAKQELFRMLGRQGKKAAAVINADDPRSSRLRDVIDPSVKVVTYGLKPGADIRAEDIQLSSEGSRFRLVTPWGAGEARLSLLGRFNVSNALAAAGVAGVLGMPFDRMIAGLAHMPQVPGRLELVSGEKTGYRVFVDYAHTDDALTNALQTLREITSGRLLVIFGCGGNRDRSKRPLMGAVASQLADVSILTSDNPRKENPQTIIEEIRAGFEPGSRVEVVEDRAQAIARGFELARPGDSVLIAGKGHESSQEFENTRVPFDDRQMARELLR